MTCFQSRLTSVRGQIPRNHTEPGDLLLGGDTARCMNDEKAALDMLKKSWSQFASADKSQCVGMVKTGGPPSYVELLSCLELMKSAAEIRNSARPGTIRDNGRRPQ